MHRFVGWLTRDRGLGLGALVRPASLSATNTSVRPLGRGPAGDWRSRMIGTRGGAWASVFLAFGIAGTYFVALGLVAPELVGGTNVTSLGILKSPLPAATGGACLLILALALPLAIAAAVLNRRFINRLAIAAGRFRTLADATSEGLIFERDGHIVDANRAIGELTGSDTSLLIGRPLSDLFPGLDPQAIDAGHAVEHDLRRSDGQSGPVEILLRNDRDSDGRVLVVRDIAAERVAARQVELLARSDSLTGLANRDLFEQQLHQALALSERTTIGVAVIYIDLDRFESVNAALGRGAGEHILIQTARRLTGTVRVSDTVARVGQDQFAIIQSLADQPADAAALADRIVTEMALPFSVDDRPLVITASIGVALYPAGGTGVHDLINSAMLAMRQAKHEGRGRWRYFEPGMDLLLRAKRSMEYDLRTALREGQFSLNYQPFLDTVTLEVAGYEALLRWDHPERGCIAPVDFISLAEESGLIVPIGSWVLATACAEAASWDQPLIISVNLSPAQFVQPGIVGMVAGVLHQAGLPPNRLELEITEGTLMDDTQNALEILTSLKALGVKLAMDDFGTGYSSLSYLRIFPFDKIKIDRSFISDVGDEAETIVHAIIAMGHGLGLDVTAEGVETQPQPQLALLRTQGCDFVQGHLLGRPWGAAQLDLSAGKRRRAAAGHAGPRLVAAATGQLV